MDAVTAAHEARRHIDYIGNRRYDARLPELADLIEAHRYFGVYALGRTAPARSGPHLTHALLALFPAGLVAKAFTWADDVDAMRDAYIEAVDAAGDRLLGDLDRAKELADALEALVDVSDLAHRPLAAAWADLPRPAGPGARIERAATVLREHRGNGHVSVLATHGLVGPDALLVMAAWRDHDDLEGNARYFGWRDDDLAASLERLRRRGWLSDRQLTDEGRAARIDIERETDELAGQPWAAVSGDDRARTVELLVAAGEALRARA